MRMRSTNTYSVTFANGQTEVFTTSRECHFVAAYFCPVADKMQVSLWSKTMAAAKARGQFIYGSNKEGKSAKLRLHIFPCTGSNPQAGSTPACRPFSSLGAAEPEPP